MKFYPGKFILIFAVVFAVGVIGSFAQITPPSDPFPSRRQPESDLPKSISENLEKQRIEKSKKDHEELLERGGDVLLLSEKLEYELEKKGQFSKEDLDKLEQLEKLAVKIRKDLGGGKDDEPDEEFNKEVASTQDITGAFRYLRASTVKLVSELKKSSRHSISAVAIEASNSVIKAARFLRLRK